MVQRHSMQCQCQCNASKMPCYKKGVWISNPNPSAKYAILDARCRMLMWMLMQNTSLHIWPSFSSSSRMYFTNVFLCVCNVVSLISELRKNSLTDQSSITPVLRYTNISEAQFNETLIYQIHWGSNFEGQRCLFVLLDYASSYLKLSCSLGWPILRSQSDQ